LVVVRNGIIKYGSHFLVSWLVLGYQVTHKLLWNLFKLLGKSDYEGGRKSCRRCEVNYFHNGGFWPCCGMPPF
jgi:hypothetical protein